jgi:hypothetical protein
MGMGRGRVWRRNQCQRSEVKSQGAEGEIRSRSEGRVWGQVMVLIGFWPRVRLRPSPRVRVRVRVKVKVRNNVFNGQY